MIYNVCNRGIVAMLKTFHFALTDRSNYDNFIFFLSPAFRFPPQIDRQFRGQFSPLFISRSSNRKRYVSRQNIKKKERKSLQIPAIIRKELSIVAQITAARFRKCRRLTDSLTAGRAQWSPIDLCARFLAEKV